MEATRTGGLKTTPMGTNKAVMVDPNTNRMRTPRAGPTSANKAATVDPTTNRTRTPRADTDDQTTPMGATGGAMVNPMRNRMETPRETTDDLETPAGATSAVMVDLTTTAMLDRKLPTEATPPVKSYRMITPTGAIREATVDPKINLVPMVDRRNSGVVRL